MRNLYRLKVTDQGGKEFKTHAVADSRYQAIVSLKDHLESVEGSTAVIEVEQVGDVEIMPEGDVMNLAGLPPSLPPSAGVKERPTGGKPGSPLKSASTRPA